jgi:hypothetical protein
MMKSDTNKIAMKVGLLPYPSSRERERAVGREGRSEAEARVGAGAIGPMVR